MSANYKFIKSSLGTDTGQESPTVDGQFLDGNGNPMDIAGKTVYFTMRPWNAATYTVNAQPATVIAYPTGQVEYGLSPDEAQPGHYLAEWTAQPGNLRLPVEGYVHVIIAPHL